MQGSFELSLPSVCSCHYCHFFPRRMLQVAQRVHTGDCELCVTGDTLTKEDNPRKEQLNCFKNNSAIKQQAVFGNLNNSGYCCAHLQRLDWYFLPRMTPFLPQVWWNELHYKPRMDGLPEEALKTLRDILLKGHYLAVRDDTRWDLEAPRQISAL